MSEKFGMKDRGKRFNIRIERERERRGFKLGFHLSRR